MELPAFPDGLEPDVRDIERGCVPTDLTLDAAVKFVCYRLQFDALDAAGYLNETTPEAIEINGALWNYSGSATGGCVLLEGGPEIDPATNRAHLTYLLLPSFTCGERDMWALLGGTLPRLSFTCIAAWHHRIGNIDNNLSLRLDALVMAELASLLPNRVWPSDADLALPGSDKD